MSFMWLTSVSNRPLDTAMDIALNYFMQKYGSIDESIVYRAGTVIRTSWLAGVSHPVKLANKAIMNLENSVGFPPNT
jgi:predicted butyrate kinase (DUF1464 family)